MENLYLIKCNEFYKIGIATDLENRLAALQTGNPYPLEVEACYQFVNASVVEKALHQRFSASRTIGEWFRIGDSIEDFKMICSMLGGREIRARKYTEPDLVEEAEEIQETASEGAKWDYAAMFADGWRMNVQDSRRLYWNWRKGSDSSRKTIYGGVVAELPYSIDDMKRVYRDGEDPTNQERLI